MITTGRQSIPVRLNGKGYSETVCILLLIAFIVSGCSAGRGDWKHELIGGYTINRINAHGIALVHYAENEDSGTYVIHNFYVTDFCMNQEYIGVQGIPTIDMWATDAEIQNDNRVIYLVDVASGVVYGPYSDMEGFQEQCNVVSVGRMGEWRSTAELAVHY